MYTPPHFEESRTDVLQEFIRRHPFAAVVAGTSGGLDAEHVPLLLDAGSGDHGVLQGHVARANPVWRSVSAGSEVLVLFSGLIAGFYQARSMLYEFLHIFPGNQENTFICAQSILINAAVVVLMVFALRLKSRELRNVAILVTVIGAGKVFMIDLLSTSGIPLVLSVLSFGLVALTESYILARWQKFEKATEPGATG